MNRRDAIAFWLVFAAGWFVGAVAAAGLGPPWSARAAAALMLLMLVGLVRHDAAARVRGD